MNRKANWIVPAGTLLILAITVTLFLVPNVMAESGKAQSSDILRMRGCDVSSTSTSVRFRFQQTE